MLNSHHVVLCRMSVPCVTGKGMFESRSVFFVSTLKIDMKRYNLCYTNIVDLGCGYVA